jgi:hypothetical protein
MTNNHFPTHNEYFLNFNYGKVVTGPNNPDVAVAIYDLKGGLAHRTCIGELTLTQATQMVEEQNAYVTYFFGSSGYRDNDNNSWHFLSGENYLMACVMDRQVWVVTDKGFPFVFTPNCPHFDLIKDIVVAQTAPRKNNVFAIGVKT